MAAPRKNHKISATNIATTSSKSRSAEWVLAEGGKSSAHEHMPSPVRI
jgi:hypothetical protein